MKLFPWWVGMGVVISSFLAATAFAQDDTAWRTSVSEDLRGINESIKRLTDRLDVLENNYAEMQKQIIQMQNELRTLEMNPPTSAKDIERLDASLKQLDAARERDKAALIDQVADLTDTAQIVDCLRGPDAGGASHRR